MNVKEEHMAEFIWAPEGPPPSLSPRQHKYDAILTEIETRPTQWARILMATRSGADSLKKSIRNGRRVGKWESEVRHLGEEFWLYVRYVGPE